MKSGDLVVSRHAYPDARSIVRKGCVLAFFSVVASYSNLSTFSFSDAKIESFFFICITNERD